MGLLIFMTVFWRASAFAETLESRFLEQLTRAHSSAAVDHLKNTYEELKVARGACKIQLSERTPPSACYASLRLENSLGINATHAQKAKLLSRLDSLCASATLKLRVSKEQNDLGVSNACARHIREARAIQEYRQDE